MDGSANAVPAVTTAIITAVISTTRLVRITRVMVPPKSCVCSV